LDQPGWFGTITVPVLPTITVAANIAIHSGLAVIVCHIHINVVAFAFLLLSLLP
jgi:hypothetical protein